MREQNVQIERLTQVHEVRSGEASDFSERRAGSDGEIPEKCRCHFSCDAEVYVEGADYRRLAGYHHVRHHRRSVDTWKKFLLRFFKHEHSMFSSLFQRK